MLMSSTLKRRLQQGDNNGKVQERVSSSENLEALDEPLLKGPNNNENKRKVRAGSAFQN